MPYPFNRLWPQPRIFFSVGGEIWVRRGANRTELPYLSEIYYVSEAHLGDVRTLRRYTGFVFVQLFGGPMICRASVAQATAPPRAGAPAK
ncbi:MAG TPA: hypothetical protein VHW60_17730 [Caulobacteraceae bacterium]|jgi:hypothetical protein|nr:hypothetical protein [Caulobacteraceae bacterium]